MAVCPSCGTENTEGSKFCNECGTKFAVTTVPEQRRTCTIVFCDLVGFTQRSESLDPEDVRQFLLPYYDLMTEEVTRYGGAIDKLYGDGAMAVFGVPTAHEDDPERAIRASLRVLERLPSLELNLQARIGINTGEVVVSIGHAARGDALTGDTVNTASRVQSAAPVGGVVVGELTYEATKHVFDYEVLEPVGLKGKAEPVAIFRPVAPIAVVEEPAREPTPFVGREAELAKLVKAFDAAKAGTPTFVTIVAEPGMGKSRLVREFARYVDDLPELVTWRQGRCLPYGEGISFWALGEIVKTHAGILDTDDQATVSAKLDVVLTEPHDTTRAWMKDRLAPLVGLSSTTAAPERGELFAAWRRFFTQLGSDDPLVLVIEDLHWAHESLFEFLLDLRRQLDNVPIMVVATARPEVAERHISWLDGDEIRLQALGEDPMRELVGATLIGASAELVAAVCDRSGGSPLYAEQLAAMRRMMPIAGGSNDDLPIPPTVQALLGARLDMLSPELLASLLDASVVGKTFWAGAVATLGALDAATTDQRLAELVAREFIREDAPSTIEGEPQYSFVHALLHDVAYGRLSRKPRFAKHKATAAWIVGHVDRPMGHVADIEVAHLDRAKEAATAAGLAEEIAPLDSALVDALTDAARHAERTDVPTAVLLIERALQLVDDDDPRLATVSYLGGAITSNAGDIRREVELLDVAIPRLREMERWDELGEALTGLGATLKNMGDQAGGEAVLAAAREEFASHSGPGLVAVLTQIAWDAAAYRPVATVIEDVEAAERAADDAGLPQPPRLVEIRASSDIEDGDVERGYARWRQAADRALADGDASTAAFILNDMGSNLQGWAADRAMEACDAAVAIVEERGLDPTIGRGVRTTVLMILGRWDEVVAETPTWIEIAEEQGNTLSAQGFWTPLARVLLDRGRPDLIDTERFEPPRFATHFDPRPWSVHLRLHALRGDIELGPVRDLIASDELVGSASLMSALIDVGAVDIAERYLQAFDESVDPIAPGWAEGLLHAGRGDWAEADVALSTTVDLHRRAGSVYFEAEGLTWLGRCAIGLRDDDLARERLMNARELWVLMGADARIAEVDALSAMT